VQDGGVAGTVSNLLFLLLLGAFAEQLLERRQWLLCYFGAGLAGELAGYAWQPRGGREPGGGLRAGRSAGEWRCWPASCSRPRPGGS
jgi:membrane associated rhomboid family serine protease